MTTEAADLALINASVVTLDPRRPRAEAIAIRDGRIQHVGTRAEALALADASTAVLDAEGGVAIPAFHDAHLHLLSYARGRSRVDCRAARSIADIQALLRERAAALPSGAWVLATGCDDSMLAERRHPTRCDLDAAVPDRPVRLQHRGRHLDVFNTLALRLLGLESAAPSQLERDPDTGEATGRLYNGAALLQRLRTAPPEEDLARDVRAATDELLARGITTVQDATFTNRPDELALFQRLAASADLRVRLYVFRGAASWRDFPDREIALSSRDRSVATSLPSCGREAGRGMVSDVRIGPIKIMLDEATTDPEDVRRIVAEARAAGQAVAFHAVSEAEIAIALDALRAALPRRDWRAGPDRIEHGAVIPDAWLADLRAAGVHVVGQPALVHERSDAYRAAYPVEQHGWLHRARSLVAAGIPYAAGSDAPVTDPRPIQGMWAARTRLTASGTRLGAGEALTPMQALAAFTRWPARAVGAGRELGVLRRGAIADIAVLDPEALDASIERETARMTVMGGRVVWRREGGGLVRP